MLHAHSLASLACSDDRRKVDRSGDHRLTQLVLSEITPLTFSFLLSKSSYVFEERRWFSLPVEQVQFKTLWGEFHSMQAETVLLPLFSESLFKLQYAQEEYEKRQSLGG